jgi:hypothetical protein
MTAVPTTDSTLRRARWDGRRILFEVLHEGAELPCAISPDALRDLTASRCFKAADLLRAFAAARAAVEAVALRKLHIRKTAGTGLLTLWSDDIEEFGTAGPGLDDRGCLFVAAAAPEATDPNSAILVVDDTEDDLAAAAEGALRAGRQPPRRGMPRLAPADGLDRGAADPSVLQSDVQARTPPST